MTNSWKVGSLAAWVLIAAAMAGPAPAEAQWLRSFEARLTATATLTPEEDPCYVLVREMGTAVSRQLGTLTWSDVEVANFCSVENGVSVVAQFSLTATDGSRIFGTFETSGTFTATGGIEISGTFRFQSGTGRFEGIRGNGTIRATAPPPGSTDPIRGQMQGLYHVRGGGGGC